MVVGNTKVVQVTNIAPQATKDQMQTLFGYLGKIEDIRLYPTIRDVSCPVQSRICYVKFVDSSTVGIAEHMTNTVFIDRALIVIPVQNGDIPDEYYALEMTRNGTIVPGFNVNEPKMPPHVSNSIQGSGMDQVIITSDPQLDANGLMPYPPLPYNYDSIKVEETRRTVLVRNIDPSIPTEEIIDFFNKEAGEVKYLRPCETSNDKYFLIEFTDQPTIIKALQLDAAEFKGKTIEVQHATQPIVKPQAKSNEAAQKEIEEAMSRFKEAQNMINASIEPVIGMLTKDKRSSRRSRSRSRGRRRRSRSRSRSRRSRSRRRRSTSRSTRKSRSRDRRKRSKSRSRKRSRSRSHGSRSRRSKSRRSRSRSRKRSKHRSKERDSRSRARSHDRKSRDRSRDRKRDKDRKSREKESKSKDKSSRENKDKKDKNDKDSSTECSGEKKKSRSRSRSRRSRSKDRKKDKDRKRSRSKGRKRSPTPKSSKKRSRSKSRDKKKEKKERKRDRSRSKSKIPRNYDEEEKGFDSEKDRKDKDGDSNNDKDSSEKSDNMDISNSP